MSLSKFKKSNDFTAVRKFTNRDKPLEVFNTSLREVISGSRQFKVIVYYGYGGIGKSTLLNELNSSLRENTNRKLLRKVHPVHISLDAFEYNSPIEILSSIRKQLKIPTILFDYAVIRYYSLQGKSVGDVKRSIGTDSILFEVLNFGANISGAVIPLNLIFKSFLNIKDKYYTMLSKYKSNIKEISDLNEMDLFDRLPHYLGLAIEEAVIQNETTHVFFMDAYETILKKTENKAVSRSSEEWIKEFIGSSENGLFVLSSRDYIKWEETNPRWGEYLEQHILGSLSDDDADYFLKHVPIKEAEIRNEIIKSAKGVPLHLDLCVNIYELKKSKNEMLNSSDFISADNEVIDRFLRHLNEEEKELMKFLSILEIFTYEYFSHLIHYFSVGYATTKFPTFIKRSIISTIDIENGLYKINESVSSHIVVYLDGKFISQILKATLEYIYSQINNDNDEIIFKYFVKLTSKHYIIQSPSLSYVEKYIEVSFYFINKGYWNSIGNSILITINLHTSKLLKNALNIIMAVFYRRTNSISTAKELMETVEVRKSFLGNAKLSVLFQKANITRLSGNYIDTNKAYHDLMLKLDGMNEYENLSIKVKRQFSDLKFLLGDFTNSLKLIEEILDKDMQINELAETIRIKGHIYRFNWFLEDAEIEYKKALQIAKDNNIISLEGKIYTNLIETYCWNNQEEAIKIFGKAIEINEMLNSSIELGKIYAAIAISYRGLDSEKAKEFAQMAIDIQNKSGYQSGVLFGYYALGIIEMTNNELNLDHPTWHKINLLIGDLQVYPFLMLPFLLKIGCQGRINKLINSISLLKVERTIKMIDNFV